MENNPRVDALSFLKAHKTGVLATVSRDYKPHASLVNYICDENFNIYFMTLRESRKFQALSAHSEIAFTIATEGVPQTLQIEGKAMDISSSEEAASKKDELFELLNKNSTFNPPMSKMDIGEPAIVWIEPTWIRWADYAFGEDGNEKVWKEIDIKK
jgi:nitroimidazol reductase NimA-like FMN-containing flavoprotein (pyridoxamine 5'-phosphate oxidase superfamily)